MPLVETLQLCKPQSPAQGHMAGKAGVERVVDFRGQVLIANNIVTPPRLVLSRKVFGLARQGLDI